MAEMVDTKDAPIWNAIDAKNYKQALNLVNKRIAKNPSEYLEVSASIHFHPPQDENTRD